MKYLSLIFLIPMFIFANPVEFPNSRYEKTWEGLSQKIQFEHFYLSAEIIQYEKFGMSDFDHYSNCKAKLEVYDDLKNFIDEIR